MARRTMIFIDGENITQRYQHMLDEGRTPRSHVVHVKDAFVWVGQITAEPHLHELIRCGYYTTHVGDPDSLHDLSIQLAKIRYDYSTEQIYCGTGYVVPYVFKKAKQIQKSASVDINITIDMLRCTYINAVDDVWLLSGDGDYIPLIREVMRQGKSMFVGAFSSGLNKEIPTIVDEFRDLDSVFFT